MEVHSGVAITGHVILGLFAVGACGDCIADDRIFCQIQRCVVLVPALELSVFVKCGLSAHGAHEDVLAVERIVVAQMIDLLHILVYHVADRQSVGIFISSNGLCSTIFVGIVVCPACFICRIQTAVLIAAFPAVQHILDAQQRVRNFGVAVIAGIVAVHAVTQGFNEIDGTGVHNRTGVRDTFQSECRIIVDTAEEGLFRTVEAVVLFLQHLCCRTSVLHVVLIGGTGGVCHFLVDVLHGIYSVVGCFAAYHDQHHSGQGNAYTTLALRDLSAQHEVQQNQVNAHECRRDPDSTLCHLVKVQTGNNGNNDRHYHCRADQVLLFDAVAVCECSCRHGQEHKGQQECIAERQPVRHLSAVPHHVYRCDQHAHYHYSDQQRVTDLLFPVDLFVQVEQGQQHQGQQTAVDFRLALYVYRVILCRQQLREHVQQVAQEHQQRRILCIFQQFLAQRERLEPEAVVRICEFELTQFQSVVHRQQHECRTCQCNDGRIRDPYKRGEIVITLPLLVRAEAQIKQEVQDHEEADHVADVEVCHTHQCQRNDEIQPAAVIDQIFNAQHDQRQEYQTVQPHGVDQLDHAVCHHRIHGGEEQ